MPDSQQVGKDLCTALDRVIIRIDERRQCFRAQKPGALQPALAKANRGQVMGLIGSGGGRLDTTRVYNTVRIVSRVKNTSGGKRAKIDVTVDRSYDEGAIPYTKTLLVHDDKLRSETEAENRAMHELAKTQQGQYVLTYHMRGFGCDGNIFAVDTIASVIDDIEGIEGEYYIIGRTFERSEQAGPSTTLRLVPKDSIVLSEVA